MRMLLFLGTIVMLALVAIVGYHAQQPKVITDTVTYRETDIGAPEFQPGDTQKTYTFFAEIDGEVDQLIVVSDDFAVIKIATKYADLSEVDIDEEWITITLMLESEPEPDGILEPIDISKVLTAEEVKEIYQARIDEEFVLDYSINMSGRCLGNKGVFAGGYYRPCPE